MFHKAILRTEKRKRKKNIQKKNNEQEEVQEFYFHWEDSFEDCCVPLKIIFHIHKCSIKWFLPGFNFSSSQQVSLFINQNFISTANHFALISHSSSWEVRGVRNAEGENAKNLSFNNIVFFGRKEREKKKPVKISILFRQLFSSFIYYFKSIQGRIFLFFFPRVFIKNIIYNLRKFYNLFFMFLKLFLCVVGLRFN